MIQIRPASDLHEKFSDIEKIVNEGSPVYLTKDGYGAVVVLSLEQYAKLTDDVELKLDEADKVAALSERRLAHDEVFAKYKGNAR
jgi:prevent-host-death family protein